MTVDKNNFHRTLKRQIIKYLDGADHIPDNLLPLFDAISKTYHHFDEDRALIERSLDVSSNELREYISQLKAIFEANYDAVLVVDGKGKMKSFNEQFVKMWKIPQVILDQRDDNKALDFAMKQLIKPEEFLAKVNELYSKPEESSKDILEFKDGRVYERFSIPLKIKDQTVGRVWNFHDITEVRKDSEMVQQKISESEKLIEIMTGRELKMIELKNEIAELKKKLREEK